MMRGWFYTIFGPLLAGAAGFLPGAGIITAVKVTLGATLLAFVSWGSVAATNWWHSDKLTIAQSDQRCADTISIATLNAKIAAVDVREYMVRSREETIAADEEAHKALLAKLKGERDATAKPGDNGVLVPADDEWLQRYRARHAASGRR